MLYRQGDVLVRKVKMIPAGAKALPRDPRGIVLAEGEATGHAHRILDDGAVMLTTAENATFIRLAKKSQLVHEEHATLDIPAGDYQVIRQREYTSWGVRQVRD